jgi:hypothetical protein
LSLDRKGAKIPETVKRPSVETTVIMAPNGIMQQVPRMTIDLSPEMESRLKAKADAEGVTVGAYVEHLVSAEEARGFRLAAFEQAITERLRSLSQGENVDGEEVMARILAELDEPQQVRIVR